MRRIMRWQRAQPQTLVERIGWGNPDPDDINDLDLANFRREWDALDSSSWGEEEWLSESPRVLGRSIGLSRQSQATFNRLVNHRRHLASTREALVLPSEPASNSPDPGYTIVHVATGIMGSFLVESGCGTVLAKSYSNELKPRYIADSTPRLFYGYGVGRRLYLAAHALWPNVRWQDGAVQATSQSLRKGLHSANAFTWQDSQCQECLCPWRTASRAKLERHHLEAVTRRV